MNPLWGASGGPISGGGEPTSMGAGIGPRSNIGGNTGNNFGSSLGTDISRNMVVSVASAGHGAGGAGASENDDSCISQVFFPDSLLTITSHAFLIGWNLDAFRCCVVCCITLPSSELHLLEEALEQSTSSLRNRIRLCSRSGDTVPVILGEWIPNIGTSAGPIVPSDSYGIWIVLTESAPSSSDNGSTPRQPRLYSVYSMGCLYRTHCYLVQYTLPNTDNLEVLELFSLGTAAAGAGHSDRLQDADMNDLVNMHKDSEQVGHTKNRPVHERGDGYWNRSEWTCVVNQINIGYDLEKNIVQIVSTNQDMNRRGLSMLAALPVKSVAADDTNRRSNTPANSTDFQKLLLTSTNVVCKLFISCSWMWLMVVLWVIHNIEHSTLWRPFTNLLESWFGAVSILTRRRSSSTDPQTPSAPSFQSPPPPAGPLARGASPDEAVPLVGPGDKFNKLPDYIAVIETHVQLRIRDISFFATGICVRITKLERILLLAADLMQQQQQRQLDTVPRRRQAFITIVRYLLFTIVDILLGILCGYIIYQRASTICDLLAATMRKIEEILILRIVLSIDKIPFGLKFNYLVTKNLTKVILFVLNYFRLFLTVINGHVSSNSGPSSNDVVSLSVVIIVRILACIGSIFGICSGTELVIDCLRILSLPITLIHRFTSFCHILQLNLMNSFWKLFQGKKLNVLRQNRVDSCEYDRVRLLFGTILFAIMLFVYPSFAVYFLLFAMLQLLMILLQCILWFMTLLVKEFPYELLLLVWTDVNILPIKSYVELVTDPVSNYHKGVTTPPAGTQPDSKVSDGKPVKKKKVSFSAPDTSHDGGPSGLGSTPASTYETAAILTSSLLQAQAPSPTRTSKYARSSRSVVPSSSNSLLAAGSDYRGLAKGSIASGGLGPGGLQALAAAAKKGYKMRTMGNVTGANTDTNAGWSPSTTTGSDFGADISHAVALLNRSSNRAGPLTSTAATGSTATLPSGAGSPASTARSSASSTPTASSSSATRISIHKSTISLWSHICQTYITAFWHRGRYSGRYSRSRRANKARSKAGTKSSTSSSRSSQPIFVKRLFGSILTGSPALDMILIHISADMVHEHSHDDDSGTSSASTVELLTLFDRASRLWWALHCCLGLDAGTGATVRSYSSASFAASSTANQEETPNSDPSRGQSELETEGVPVSVRSRDRRGELWAASLSPSILAPVAADLAVSPTSAVIRLRGPARVWLITLASLSLSLCVSCGIFSSTHALLNLCIRGCILRPLW
jgi:hypothetical protein